MIISLEQLQFWVRDKRFDIMKVKVTIRPMYMVRVGVSDEGQAKSKVTIRLG